MLVRLVAVILTLLVATHGFIFSAQTAHPALMDMAKAQQGTLLNIGLEIGKENDQSRLFLDGLGLQLLMDPKKDNRPKMPGADGPHNKLSSGANSLALTKLPFYISMNGMQKVQLDDGCWEVIWRDGAQAGALICGFNVPIEHKRNEATLPAGRLYVTFPVWTRENLEEYQEKKKKAEDRAEVFLQEKEKQLSQMKETDNLFKKALHFRNAAAAMEKYSLTGIEQYKQIPMSDDVLEINKGLLLTTKGTVWTKDTGFFGPDHALIGYAVVRPDETKDLAP